MKAFLYLSYFLGAFGVLILLFLWIPFRRTGLLNAIPWIVGAFILTWILTPLSDLLTLPYKEQIDAMAFGPGLVSNYAIWTILIGGIWKSALSLLVASNVAFILEQLQFTSRLTRFLLPLYRTHYVLGIILMAITFVSLNLLWVLIQISILTRAPS
jgi:hypothetical protein